MDKPSAERFSSLANFDHFICRTDFTCFASLSFISNYNMFLYVGLINKVMPVSAKKPWYFIIQRMIATVKNIVLP